MPFPIHTRQEHCSGLRCRHPENSLSPSPEKLRKPSRSRPAPFRSRDKRLVESSTCSSSPAAANAHTSGSTAAPREHAPALLLFAVVVAFLRACSSLFFVLITTSSLLVQLSLYVCVFQDSEYSPSVMGGLALGNFLDLGMNCEERGRGEVNGNLYSACWTLVQSCLYVFE